MQHSRKVSFPVDGLPHYVKITVTIVTVHHKCVISDLIHKLRKYWGLLGQNKSHRTGTSCTNCSADSLVSQYRKVGKMQNDSVLTAVVQKNLKIILSSKSRLGSTHRYPEYPQLIYLHSFQSDAFSALAFVDHVDSLQAASLVPPSSSDSRNSGGLMQYLCLRISDWYLNLLCIMQTIAYSIVTCPLSSSIICRV